MKYFTVHQDHWKPAFSSTTGALYIITHTHLFIIQFRWPPFPLQRCGVKSNKQKALAVEQDYHLCTHLRCCETSTISEASIVLTNNWESKLNWSSGWHILFFFHFLICNNADTWALILKLFHHWYMGKRISFLKKSSQFCGIVGFTLVSFISFH